MALGTIKIEIEQTLLQGLLEKATARGLSLEAFLRQLIESENGVATHTPEIEAEPATPPLTPYQIAKAKGLLGAVDSSVLDPASPPIQTEFGRHLLEEYRKQLADFTQPH